MSLLIMSIGIVSVLALYPLSMINSIRANQVTNGVILQDNVQALCETFPQLVEPPVDQSVWQGNWQQRTQYNVGDVVIPTLLPDNIVPVPYVRLTCTTAGVSGNYEPQWSKTVGDTVTELNGPEWTVGRIPNFVSDPIGYYAGSPPLAGGSTYATIFGNRDATGDDLSSLTYPFATRSRCPSFRANYTGVAPYIDPRPLFTLEDTWSVLSEEMPVAMPNSTTLTFGPTVDLSDIPLNTTNLSLQRISRVILSNTNFTRFITRYPMPGTTGSTLVVDQPVPANYNGAVRFEVFNPRYSYIVAVSNNSTATLDLPPTISSAIIFNRNPSANAEYAYKANFGNLNFTADASVSSTTLATDQVRIAWTSGEPTPAARVGGHVIDVQRALIYRITGVQEDVGGSAMTLTLSGAIENTHQTGNANSIVTGVNYATILPGVLNTYLIQ